MSVIIGIDDAVSVQGYEPGNTSGDIPINNGTLNVNLKAEMLGLQGPGTGTKVKELTGTTNSTQGTSVTVAHGITNASKIYPPQVSINYSGNSWVNSAYLYNNSGAGGYVFAVEYNDTNVTVSNSINDSSNILSKPFKILVFYKE